NFTPKAYSISAIIPKNTTPPVFLFILYDFHLIGY
ncbi:uncharacterized protein METZ01_LOCUS468986, partial [marine metagenome]